MKTALITGINGQAGAVMAEYLLKKEYHVVGLIRRSSTDTKWRLKENVLNQENFILVEGDICDSGSINSIVIKHKPDELYHYAAQSHVHTSFEQPYYTNYVNVCGTLNILESIRMFSPTTKIYNSSSSEMFGSNYTEQYESKLEDTGIVVNKDTIAKLAKAGVNRFICGSAIVGQANPKAAHAELLSLIN